MMGLVYRIGLRLRIVPNGGCGAFIVLGDQNEEEFLIPDGTEVLFSGCPKPLYDKLGENAPHNPIGMFHPGTRALHVRGKKGDSAYIKITELADRICQIHRLPF